jgi:glutamate/aspartate transport system permease protein
MTNLDFSVIWSSWRQLAEGIGFSLTLLVLALAGGMLFGTLLATFRLSPFRSLALFGAGYVSLFRSVPLVLVIFWFYFLVPIMIGRPVGPFVSVITAYTLFETAFFCEIVRSGIQTVSRGQFAAGYATGMTTSQTMISIVLPQAFRAMLPVILTQGIILFQDTSLVYVVALSDFMTTASLIANREDRLVEVYLFCAAVYFCLCFAASRSVKQLQRRLSHDRTA